MTVLDLHRLRNGHHSRDVAIVDLLHLRQLDLAPGRIPVALLRNLWGISQPQVSRRMAAIGALGVFEVYTDNRGGYVIRRPRPQPQRNRLADSHLTKERWDAARQQLQRLIDRS